MASLNSSSLHINILVQCIDRSSLITHRPPARCCRLCRCGPGGWGGETKAGLSPVLEGGRVRQEEWQLHVYMSRAINGEGVSGGVKATGLSLVFR